MVNIHCPKCSNKKMIIIKPTMENGFTHYRFNGKLIGGNIFAKTDEVVVYCTQCNHYHVMKKYRLSNNNGNKPKTQKIKGYGTYHY